MSNQLANHFRSRIELWNNGIKLGVQVPSHIDRSEVELMLMAAIREIETLQARITEQASHQ